jgi:hypothetical protein
MYKGSTLLRKSLSGNPWKPFPRTALFADFQAGLDSKTRKTHMEAGFWVIFNVWSNH